MNSNFNFKKAASVFSWTREYLFRVMTEGKNPAIYDPIVINAFRMVDRKNFVPNEFNLNAYEDKDINIGYGETLTRPTVIARMIQLMQPKPGGKYLDLGSGTGYAAAVLSYIAGNSGFVFSLERIQWLWEMAKSNNALYTHTKNVRFFYRDGRLGLTENSPYDGIHVAFSMPEIPQELKEQLSKDGGKMVIPLTNYDLRVIERHGDDEYTEEIIPGYLLSQAKTGVS